MKHHKPILLMCHKRSLGSTRVIHVGSVTDKVTQWQDFFFCDSFCFPLSDYNRKGENKILIYAIGGLIIINPPIAYISILFSPFRL